MAFLSVLDTEEVEVLVDVLALLGALGNGVGLVIAISPGRKKSVGLIVLVAAKVGSSVDVGVGWLWSLVRCEDQEVVWATSVLSTLCPGRVGLAAVVVRRVQVGTRWSNGSTVEQAWATETLVTVLETGEVSSLGVTV